MPETALTLEVCRPIAEHARLVMEWRNDPHTLAMFYHHEPKVWATFWLDYRDTYFGHPAFPPLFVVAGEEKIAFIRYLPVSRSNILGARIVEISINLAPKARGRGLGVAAIALGSQYLKQETDVDLVYAEVRVENRTSRRAFAAAGYSLVDEVDKTVVDTGEVCRIVRFHHNLGSLKNDATTSRAATISGAGLFVDLDGTLADSLPVMRLAYDRFLTNYDKFGSDEEFASFNGPPLVDIVRDLTRIHDIDAPLAASMDLYVGLIEKAYANVVPLAGAWSLISAARRRGMMIGVVTSNASDLATRWLRAVGLLDLVDVVVGGDNVRRGKPAPDPYLMALERSGCNALTSLAIEDSYTGASAAIFAGLPTLFLSRSDTIPPGITGQIACLDDAVAFLDRDEN